MNDIQLESHKRFLSKGISRIGYRYRYMNAYCHYAETRDGICNLVILTRDLTLYRHDPFHVRLFKTGTIMHLNYSSGINIIWDLSHTYNRYCYREVEAWRRVSALEILAQEYKPSIIKDLYQRARSYSTRVFAGITDWIRGKRWNESRDE